MGRHLNNIQKWKREQINQGNGWGENEKINGEDLTKIAENAIYAANQEPIVLPPLEIQYIKDEYGTAIRFVSENVNQELINQLSRGTIRVQIWLEKLMAKKSHDRLKENWIHPKDHSGLSTRLFTRKIYNYGGGNGWGITALKPNNGDYYYDYIYEIPDYAINKGYINTEIEIGVANIDHNRIMYNLPLTKIIPNLIRRKEKVVNNNQKTIRYHLEPTDYSELNSNSLKFIGYSKSFKIRAKLVAVHDNNKIDGCSKNNLLVILKDNYVFNSISQLSNCVILKVE